MKNIRAKEPQGTYSVYLPSSFWTQGVKRNPCFNMLSCTTGIDTHLLLPWAPVYWCSRLVHLTRGQSSLPATQKPWWAGKAGGWVWLESINASCSNCRAAWKGKGNHCVEYKLCSAPRTAPVNNSFSVCAWETVWFLGNTSKDEVTSVRKVAFEAPVLNFSALDWGRCQSHMRHSGSSQQDRPGPLPKVQLERQENLPTR